MPDILIRGDRQRRFHGKMPPISAGRETRTTAGLETGVTCIVRLSAKLLTKGGRDFIAGVFYWLAPLARRVGGSRVSKARPGASAIVMRKRKTKVDPSTPLRLRSGALSDDRVEVDEARCFCCNRLRMKPLAILAIKHVADHAAALGVHFALVALLDGIFRTV